MKQASTAPSRPIITVEQVTSGASSADPVERLSWEVTLKTGPEVFAAERYFKFGSRADAIEWAARAAGVQIVD